MRMLLPATAIAMICGSLPSAAAAGSDATRSAVMASAASGTVAKWHHPLYLGNDRY